MNRIAIGIEYDGSPWQGWQRQPSGLTVQNQIEKALFQFTQEEISVVAAGRTDAGVHAIEQVAHFDTSLNRALFSWVRGLNFYLDASIAIKWAKDVMPGENGFHARASAVGRRYQYVIYNHPTPSPLLRKRVGWVFRPLDVKLMQEASLYLLGEHDFSAFRAAECQAISPVKTMRKIEIVQKGPCIFFQFEADAFLHHMVRNLVASLVYVGQKNFKPNWIDTLLKGKDRSKAAPTFMPDGLYLSRVLYEEKWDLPQLSNGLINMVF